MNKKILFVILKIVLSITSLALTVIVLLKFEYLQNLDAIDNILAMMPLSFALLFLIGANGLIWIKWNRKTLPFSIISAFWMVFAAVVYPRAINMDWAVKVKTSSEGQDGDITIYEPFKEGTKAVHLDEVSTLSLDSDLPVMDGALALYPVYASIIQNTYNKDSYNGECNFRNTLRGFKALVSGEVDIFFSAYPAKSQLEYAKENGVDIHFTPIGKEAFVFVLPNGNPINNLSVRQIQNVYSGRTSYWRTLGWNKGGQIIKFRRPEGSGSESALQNLVMKDKIIAKAQPLPCADLIGSNSLMKQMSVYYKGVQPALGYTFKWFGSVMNPNPDTKFISIDNIEPTKENIKTGAYPYTTKFYAMTVGEPKGNVKTVIDWMLSNQGQELIEKVGYTAIK